MDIKKEDIEAVFTGILTQARDELKTLSQAELSKFWFFQYDIAKSEHWNLYQFNSMLDLYSRKCRQWEEMHNGSMCVVERVRDTYLMPKIKEFLELHNARVAENGNYTHLS